MNPTHIGEFSALLTAIFWVISGMLFERASKRTSSLSAAAAFFRTASSAAAGSAAHSASQKGQPRPAGIHCFDIELIRYNGDSERVCAFDSTIAMLDETTTE